MRLPSLYTINAVTHTFIADVGIDIQTDSHIGMSHQAGHCF